MKEVAQRVAMPIKAALGRSTQVTAGECIADPGLVVGKLVKVKIGLRKGKEEGQFFNNVKEYIVEA